MQVQCYRESIVQINILEMGGHDGQSFPNRLLSGQKIGGGGGGGGETGGRLD